MQSSRFGIRGKIFFGLSILVVGYAATIAVGFTTGAKNERELASIATAGVPLSLKCQSLQFEFDGATKAFTDATMTGEEESLRDAERRTRATLGIVDEITALSQRAAVDSQTLGGLRNRIAALDSVRADIFKNASSREESVQEATRKKAAALTAETEALRSALGDLTKRTVSQLDLQLGNVTADTKNVRFFNLVLGSSLILLGVGCVIWILQRSVIRPVASIEHDLGESSDRVDSASSAIEEVSRRLADGASQQAASLEETSASLEEIASMARRNADNSLKAKQLASEARVATDHGTSDVAALRSAMDEMQASSANIAKIVKAIDEIAFQTNILALNAAVEAARAGEAGAGFAVVAEEVRNLAQRSAQAAKETSTLIEDSIGKSTRGAEISVKVTGGLEEISKRIREVDALVAEIATASQEQSSGVGEVNNAVTELDKVTQANAASAEEATATVQELSRQAVELRACINRLEVTVHGNANATAATARHTTAPAATAPSVHVPTAPARRTLATR